MRHIQLTSLWPTRVAGKRPCAKMMGMQQEQQEQPGPRSAPPPIYWDSHRGTFNISLIFALAVAALGLYSLVNGNDPLMLFAGLGVAAYTWLTTAKRYMIYENALVLEYGRPRVKAIEFSTISHIELLSLGVGDRLRVILLNGKRIMVMARDLETFQKKLDEALERYQGGNTQELQGDDGSLSGQSERIIEGEKVPEEDAERDPEFDADAGPDNAGPLRS